MGLGSKEEAADQEFWRDSTPSKGLMWRTEFERKQGQGARVGRRHQLPWIQRGKGVHESSMLSCRFEMLFPHKVCILLMKTIPDSLGIRNIRLGTVNLSNSLHIGNKTEILLY